MAIIIRFPVERCQPPKPFPPGHRCTIIPFPGVKSKRARQAQNSPQPYDYSQGKPQQLKNEKHSSNAVCKAIQQTLETLSTIRESFTPWSYAEDVLRNQTGFLYLDVATTTELKSVLKALRQQIILEQK